MLSRRPALLAAPVLVAVALAGCGGDKVDTKDAQATLRREVGPFTGVAPKHVNHTVKSLDCPGEVDKGDAYECTIRLSDGLAGTVHVTPLSGQAISWRAEFHNGGAKITSAHAG